MKTVIVDQNGKLSMAEVGLPRLEPWQARTRTIANGICGTDVTLIKGKFKGVELDSYPVMLGHENVGEVVEVGADVKTFRVGDRVILPFVDEDRENVGPYGSAWGAMCQYCVVNDPAALPQGVESEVAPAQRVLPEDIDPVDAVMLVTFREVLSAVRHFGIGPGDPVVVIGAGPVGLTFLKMCKLTGAGPVIAVVRNEEKARNARETGADVVLNSRETDVEAEVRRLVPGGVPYVIDAVGSQDVINQAMGLICDRGMLCCYGVPKQQELHIDFSKADYNWILNFQQMPRKDEEAAVHDELLAWIREGKLNLKDFISDYYPFDRAVQAYQDAVDHKIQKKAIVVF